MFDRPGYSWRYQAWRDGDDACISGDFNAEDRVCFDELSVDNWFHIEQTDEREWYVNIGDVMIYVVIPALDVKPEIVIMDERCQ